MTVRVWNCNSNIAVVDDPLRSGVDVTDEGSKLRRWSTARAPKLSELQDFCVLCRGIYAMRRLTLILLRELSGYVVMGIVEGLLLLIREEEKKEGRSS